MIDWVIFLTIGVFAGLLSGLLGIGGGIIMVPGLVEWMAYHDFETSKTMQICIGTTLSCIMIISLISGLTHKKLGVIRWDLVKILAPGTVVGGMIGVHVADILPSELLRNIFAVILSFIALHMIFFGKKAERETPSFKPWVLTLCGLFIGIVSGLIGLGGGLLIVPLLLFNGIPMTQCSSTALWCTLPTVTVAAATSIWTGLNEPDLLPHSVGYVYWPATLGICASAVISAPIGVRLAHKLPKSFLKSLLICVMAVIIVRIVMH